MITQKCIDEIKMAARIEDVVSDFVPLKRAGASYKGVCPFHDDHSPSMHITPKLGIYHCFVCGAHGDSIKFLMEYQKISYPEALRYLASKYNIAIEEEKKELTAEQEAAKNEREALLNVNAYAEKFFTNQLFESEEGRNIGLTYLRDKRGFKEETIRKFRLGYCPDTWDTFSKKAVADGYKPDDLLTLGLCRKSEKTGNLFDFYKGRVIFPILNAFGSAIGFGGRVMSQEAKGPKYYNSPENPIYHKSDVLYGFYFARRAIRERDNVYLVEGYTDVISMSEAGVENVVASSGTALTDGQIKLIKSQTNNITVLYDGDNAGIKASLRGINMLLAAGLNVKAVLLPDGEDPDSFAKGHRDSELKDYLEQNAVNIIQFEAKTLMHGAGNDPLKRAEVVNTIIETVAEVNDEVLRAFYVRECAELFQLSEESLQVNLKRALWKRMNTPSPARVTNIPQQPVQQGQPVQQQLPNVVKPEEVPQTQQPPTDPLYDLEYNIIRLILKYGFFETNVRDVDADGQEVIRRMRVDQYVFNEFHAEEISFTNPLYQHFYQEYARLAQQFDSQDDLCKAFAQHDDEALQALAIPILTEQTPDCSPAWEQRFDMDTPRPDTDIECLNQEIAGCVNLFKMRLIDKCKELLIKELESGDLTEQEQRDIMMRIGELNERAKELGNLQRIVISSQY